MSNKSEKIKKNPFNLFSLGASPDDIIVIPPALPELEALKKEKPEKPSPEQLRLDKEASQTYTDIFQQNPQIVGHSAVFSPPTNLLAPVLPLSFLFLAYLGNIIEDKEIKIEASSSSTEDYSKYDNEAITTLKKWRNELFKPTFIPVLQCLGCGNWARLVLLIDPGNKKDLLPRVYSVKCEDDLRECRDLANLALLEGSQDCTLKKPKILLPGPLVFCENNQRNLKVNLPNTYLVTIGLPELPAKLDDLSSWKLARSLFESDYNINSQDNSSYSSDNTNWAGQVMNLLCSLIYCASHSEPNLTTIKNWLENAIEGNGFPEPEYILKNLGSSGSKSPFIPQTYLSSFLGKNPGEQNTVLRVAQLILNNFFARETL